MIREKRRLKEVDIDKLFEERERQARKKTKKHKDMNNFTDWVRLMTEKPGFYRD